MPFFGKHSGQPGKADRFEPLFSGLNFPLTWVDFTLS